MSKSIVKEIQDCRVSSVLNNDRKQYGKKYLFDGKDETCWNSDGGSPQWIEFSFPEPKSVEQLLIQFQGGFAAKSCVLQTISDSKEQTTSFQFFPKDSNTSQTFAVSNLLPCNKFKLTFESSFDFYGRIIIYNVDIIGS
ncbi:Nuclear receptor 2C2-associated protein [Orchesella cincta]|uniref:Nuclear receptor 2C2-associated protein n=1 Tax=Orchesella cincta TaxID=48709 RepID=A0A1D2N8W8_ORCCI|nr:Nuclear receptor 2C2-associated protein [Orchesella cincta]